MSCYGCSILCVHKEHNLGIIWIVYMIFVRKLYHLEKVYGDETEELYRRAVFSDHVKKVVMHNYLCAKGQKSYALGINRFSDMVRHGPTWSVLCSFRSNCLQIF